MTTAQIHPKLSRTGNFDYGSIASGRRFDAAEMVDDAPRLGLLREAGYVWGTLRDDDGILYTIMRRLGGTPPGDHEDDRKSLGGRLILTSSGTDRGEGLQLRKEPRSAVDSSAIGVTLTDADTATYASDPAASGEPMHLVLSEQNFAYREAGVIDVTGTIAAAPLQWYVPGTESSLLYLTQTWLVEGTLAGKNARGFLFWEEAWMPEGGRLYIAKDPLHDAEYLTWYSWANLWEDGSTEVGHFLFGNNDFHVAISSHADGTIRSGKTMNAVITRAEDGYWHDGIAYEIDGEKWVCEPDPDGQMRGLGEMPNPQQEGRIHRVSDTRTPVVWMAWGESVPGRGNVRTH